MSAMSARPLPPDAPDADELRAFMLVVRRALLLVVDYIERRYGLKRAAVIDKRTIR